MKTDIEKTEILIAATKVNIALAKANCATIFAQIERFKAKKHELLLGFYEAVFDNEAQILGMYRKQLATLTEDLRILKMAEYYVVA